MEIQVIKEMLMKPGTKFTVEGVLEIGGSATGKIQVFKTNGDNETQAIGVDEILSMAQMNVTKFGPTCVTLYSYDMLKTKTTGKIKYEDVTILDK